MVSAKEQSSHPGSLQPLVVKEGSLLVLPQTLCSHIRESGLSAGPTHPMFLEGSQVLPLVSLEPGFRHASHSSSAPTLLPPHPNVLVRATLCGLLGCILPQYVVIFLSFKRKEKKAMWRSSSTTCSGTHPTTQLPSSQLPRIPSLSLRVGMLRRGLQSQHSTHVTYHWGERGPQRDTRLPTHVRDRGPPVRLWRLSLIGETMQLGPLILQAGTLRCIKEKQLTQWLGVREGRAGAPTHGASHHRKSVDSVPGRQAHASSVNRKELPVPFHHT